MSRDGDRGLQGVALATVRGLAAVTGVTLLIWSWRILDNVWQYNDAGTLSYVLLALVLAIPGAALVAFAILAGRFRH